MGNLHAKDTILLVDDEQVVLDVSTLMIKRLGYKVLRARNGSEASQIFRDNAEGILLVILDMKLPDEFGPETCKKLKEIRPDLKVIHTSGLGGVQSGDSLKCGCDKFLLKPFKIEVLFNTLQDLLEAISKMHLTPNSCVVSLLKMLTYSMNAALLRRLTPYSWA